MGVVAKMGSTRSRMAKMLLCFITLVGCGTLMARHDEGHDDAPAELAFNVSKTGEVNITADVKIGIHPVKKGKYMISHRVDAVRHLFTLTQGTSTTQIDSRFSPSSDIVKKSAFQARKQRDGSYEVVSIQIAGENGDHIIVR
jgi:hypothetical protein